MISSKARKNFYYVGGGEYWSKEEFYNNFSGSYDLFCYCWRRFLSCGGCVDDVVSFLEDAAAAAVNDENSKFYIYG